MNGNPLKNPEFQTLSRAGKMLIDNAFQIVGKRLPCHVVKIGFPGSNTVPAAQNLTCFVTVAFDVNSPYTLPQVTVPVFGPEYIRYPIKVGDLGVVQASDTTLSLISGQGGGTPDLSDPCPLESLYFMPVGNATWVEVDPNQVTVYAPNGCTIRDTASGAVIVLHPTEITATIGECVVQMDAQNINFTAPTAINCNTATFTINAPTIFLNGQMAQGTGATSYSAHLKGPLVVDQDVSAEGTSVHGHTHGGVEPGSGDTGPPV